MAMSPTLNTLAKGKEKLGPAENIAQHQEPGVGQSVGRVGEVVTVEVATLPPTRGASLLAGMTPSLALMATTLAAPSRWPPATERQHAGWR